MKRRQGSELRGLWIFCKEVFSFLQYFVVGALASVLAFFLSIQFLTPVFSEVEKENGKPAGVAAILKETVKEVSNVFKTTFSGVGSKKKKDTGTGVSNNAGAASSAEDTASQAPEQVEPSVERETIETVQKPLNEVGVPNETVQNPESLNEVVTPNVNQPFGETETSGEKSKAFLEVESYMVPFTYDPLNRRDPFEDPYQAQLKVEGVEKVRTPPEQFDLKSIELKGIIWDIHRPKVLVRLPDGEFYTLLRGDKVGKMGVIFEIREDEVVILENKTTKVGSKIVKDTAIFIKRMDRIGKEIRRLNL